MHAWAARALPRRMHAVWARWANRLAGWARPGGRARARAQPRMQMQAMRRERALLTGPLPCGPRVTRDCVCSSRARGRRKPGGKKRKCHVAVVVNTSFTSIFEFPF
jgi:hypothetical protein